MIGTAPDMTSTTPDQAPQPTDQDPLALTLRELEEIYSEIAEQPEWRATADKEMDYADGNQIDSDLLRKQRELGIPPAIDDEIGPALEAIRGHEKSTRTDWRVTADGEPGGQDVADAIGFRLKQAETHSKADRACSDAFKPQSACGIGWVEVARESDPFKFPYRCTAVHRNEIHWDMRAREPDLSDARWVRRQRWLTPERLALAFPAHADLIKRIGRYGADSTLWLDGGQSTGLQNAWGSGRAWTVDESLWYDSTAKELCLSEVWYRRWVQVQVLKMKDGRAVEYDETNEAHVVAAMSGAAKLQPATIARVRRAYWIGPHQLHDGPTPYPHRSVPYVPFFGFREDMTRIPYGYVRRMKYPQDSLNSGTSKLRWGMAVARVERTKGAVAMPDETFRRMVARADADIVLDAAHMAMPGARFEVKRDYNLTEQHYRMLDDNRASIRHATPGADALAGKPGSATSGLQEGIQVDQANQSLSDMMDNFKAARAQVGELLMSLIVEDMGQEETAVVIEGDAIREDRQVVINKPEVDENGQTYLSNDLLRLRLKVGLEEVPSTHTYRGQQLNAMSEAVKSLPAQYQAAAMPFLASLMDVPFKRDLVEALRAAGKAEDPKEVEKRVRADIANELKGRELELKATETEARIKEIEARAVQIGVQAAFSAMQAGMQIAQAPIVAPLADVVMEAAGYQKPTPAGVDPGFPVPGEGGIPGGAVEGGIHGVETDEAPMEAPEVQQNTSPTFPPVPSQGLSPMAGIETPANEPIRVLNGPQ